MKKNAVAGHSFASWEAFEAHLAKWEREVANVRVHGTTGEAPIVAYRLQPVGKRPSFGSLREFSRVVGRRSGERRRRCDLLRSIEGCLEVEAPHFFTARNGASFSAPVDGD